MFTAPGIYQPTKQLPMVLPTLIIVIDGWQGDCNFYRTEVILTQLLPAWLMYFADQQQCLVMKNSSSNYMS
jgi:hypothetical protein